MTKKIIILVILIATFGALSFTAYKVNSFLNDVKDIGGPVTDKYANEAGIKKDNKAVQQIEETTKFDKQKSKVFNILLLGIDRRSKSEDSFRTDIMILVTVNPAQKKIVMTSLPRDLWMNGERINGLYTTQGYNSLNDAFYKVTGMKPDAYIRCDFEDLVWLIDALGGVEIDLDTAFTDNEYPNDVLKTYITVAFKEGKQIVNGKDALVLARSRHGNNGEGSDFKRMQRQHKILKAIPNKILAPETIFHPFNIPTFYEMVTKRMTTDLTLGDSEYLWSYFKDKDQYTIESFYVDSTYLYNPPMSEYGGAWVLIAKNKDYTPIHIAIKEKVGLIAPKAPINTETTPAPVTNP